jgi:ribosomal-protein-alanine N-acetyltransferase
MTLRAMTLDDLDRVMQVEAGSYSHPWTRGNFTDSVLGGHLAWVLDDAEPSARLESRDRDLQGYLVAMPGVDEMHLLNITVAPSCRRQGHARRLMERLVQATGERGLGAVWLEVRASNAAAQHLYASLGFVQQGVRRAYYPAGHSLREDAVLMSLDLTGDRAPDQSPGGDLPAQPDAGRARESAHHAPGEGSHAAG